MKNLINKIRKIFSVGIFLVNLAIIALLLLSVFGVEIRPHQTSIFAYLGMSFPIWATLNICFIFYWLIKWNWRVYLSLLTLIITLQTTWCYFPLNFNSHQPDDKKSYKILTYNVQNLNFSKKGTHNQPNLILDYICQQDADIICMQEYTTSNRKGYLDSIDVLKALKKYPYHSIIHSNATKSQEGGLAVFSKYPIRNAREIEYFSKYNSSMICDISLPEGVITLINNHLESNQLTSEDRKVFAAFTNELSKEKAKSVVKELMPKLGAAFKKRAHQADTIRAAIDTITNQHIVCGDFNDTPGSYVYKKIKGNLNDAFAQNGKGLGITYNQNRFYFRIDHLLYSEGLNFHQTYIEQVLYSDHYPVVGLFNFE